MPTYVSKEGLEELKNELEDRKKNTRREIAEQIASAKELGDLSENFEYHDAKQRQALNEARILELDAMIKDAVIVEQQSGGDVVTLGTTFVAEMNGKEKTFEIVGSNEADPIAGKISNESPLGRNFIGKKVGETVEVQVPSGTVAYKITQIK
jgi:transcription elongation factor GreA